MKYLVTGMLLWGLVASAAFDLEKAKSDFNQKKFKSSCREFLDAYQAGKQDQEVTFYLGTCYFLAKKYNLAISTLEKDPPEVQYYSLASKLILFKSYWSKREYEKAFDLTKSLRFLDYSSAEQLEEVKKNELIQNYNDQIQELLNQNRNDFALELSIFVMKLDPENEESKLTVAQILYLQKYFRTSEKLLQNLVRSTPGNTQSSVQDDSFFLLKQAQQKDLGMEFKPGLLYLDTGLAYIYNFLGIGNEIERRDGLGLDLTLFGNFSFQLHRKHSLSPYVSIFHQEYIGNPRDRYQQTKVGIPWIWSERTKSFSLSPYFSEVFSNFETTYGGPGVSAAANIDLPAFSYGGIFTYESRQWVRKNQKYLFGDTFSFQAYQSFPFPWVRIKPTINLYDDNYGDHSGDYDLIVPLSYKSAELSVELYKSINRWSFSFTPLVQYKRYDRQPEPYNQLRIDRTWGGTSKLTRQIGLMSTLGLDLQWKKISSSWDETALVDRNYRTWTIGLRFQTYTDW